MSIKSKLSAVLLVSAVCICGSTAQAVSPVTCFGKAFSGASIETTLLLRNDQHWQLSAKSSEGETEVRLVKTSDYADSWDFDAQYSSLVWNGSTTQVNCQVTQSGLETGNFLPNRHQGSAL
jgi:hypothetical protein